ncbi:cinnamoyl-CoA reductase-like SNL6 [Impatiens glandulifera]|uniref:cinnamoyl-CoA reductase-like SNL6 n=1 Tax=Impatiens glandulifera TaxID=253017 RepID=UPI001FB16799|nr:cinnamoyl-CoA reductase-like SNL6 [Impatiens glandulifera]
MKEIADEIHGENQTVCVLDASTYVGFWVFKALISKGYHVHAAINKNGESELIRRINEMGKTDKRVTVLIVDVLDYHTITDALKGCSALFCCLDSPDGYAVDEVVDLEVMGAINVVEACAQTESIEKVIFNSSLTAAIWRENISSDKLDVDESSWSHEDFCRKHKLWHGLTKMLAEKAAWGLAIDRVIDMVSINSGLVMGPDVTQRNPHVTMSYLKGAANMYQNGVLALIDVTFLAHVNIRAFEDRSTSFGRYLCFNKVVNSQEEALKLANNLSPLVSLPPTW